MGNKIVLKIKQNFSQRLKIVVRQHIGGGQFIEIDGNSDKEQTITLEVRDEKQYAQPITVQTTEDNNSIAASLGLSEPDRSLGKYRTHDISRHFNACVTDIFRNEYLSPRPTTTTLQIPVQGIGEWCHPQFTVEINDSVLRSTVKNDMINVAEMLIMPVDKRKKLHSLTLRTLSNDIVVGLMAVTLQ